MSDKEQKVVLQCSLKFALYDGSGREVAGGEATARLSEETLALLPKMGDALLFTLREITGTSGADYRLRLDLSSGENLTFFHLGHRYDDFCRVLLDLRNELTLKDLLMYESLVRPGFKANYTHVTRDGGKNVGRGEIRLYETALVLIPEKADLQRIPYSFISALKDEDYALIVELEDGDGRLVFSHLGQSFDLFRKTLSDTMAELALRTQERLRELLPDIEPSVLRKASRLLKDGRAARRSDLESVSPALWSRLEGQLGAVGLGERYAFLRDLARPEQVCLGFKRGLVGDLTGEYIWVLLPIYSADPGRPGNVLAMEAATVAAPGGDGKEAGGSGDTPGADDDDSGDSAAGPTTTATGKATYFFRLTGLEDYRRAADVQRLDRLADEFIRSVNRCMLAINFRREPIYLSEERLREPRYAHYQAAVSRIPDLQTLRSHFIGRVTHQSPEQWKQDVLDLLEWNVSTTDDALKWRRRPSDS